MRGISLWRLIMFIFFPLSDNDSLWNCTSVKALTVSCRARREYRKHQLPWNEYAYSLLCSATTGTAAAADLTLKSFLNRAESNRLWNYYCQVRFNASYYLHFIKYIETNFDTPRVVATSKSVNRLRHLPIMKRSWYRLDQNPNIQYALESLSENNINTSSL